MKVLVVGGAGYIGSHVVRELLDQKNEVVVFDNLSTGLKQNLFSEAKFIEGDILNSDFLDASLLAERPDAIIHLAALKAAGESMEKPEKYSTRNIVGSINVINAAVAAKVKHFVFSSTAALYGVPQYLPMDEDHPTNPENYYGFTKLSIEQYLKWYSKLKGINYTALRYFNAAGYDVKNRISGLEQNPANLLPVVMEVAAGMREKMVVFGDDYPTVDGTGVRDYIHVNDLATGHVAALKYMEEKGENLIVNLGTGEGYSVLEIINIAEKITGKKVAYDIVARRDGDTAEVRAGSNRAAKFLNWKAEYSDMETIIKTTWQAYLANNKV